MRSVVAMSGGGRLRLPCRYQPKLTHAQTGEHQTKNVKHEQYIVMKKTHNLRKALPAFIGLAIATGAHGAVGFFGSYINVSTNGGDLVWYDLEAPGGNRASDPEDFNGKYFGTFDPGAGQTLTITGGEGLVYKQNVGDDVFNVKLHYSIRKVGESHDSFSTLNIKHTVDAPLKDAAGTRYESPGDQKWSDNSDWNTLQVLEGLAPGEYELQVYLSGNDDTFHSNNNNNNFTATFTVVPEPSSAALLGLGGLALMLRRRR